ncbi:hypothetical protein D3C71_1598280 [compost metagenome]
MAQFMKGYTIYKFGNRKLEEINVKNEEYEEFVYEYEATLIAAKLIGWKVTVSLEKDYYGPNIYITFIHSAHNYQRVIKISLNPNSTINKVIATNRGSKLLSPDSDKNIICAISAVRMNL